MQYANSGLDVAGPDLPRSLQRTRAALQLELCGMTLDRILANEPTTQLRVLQSSHTHTPLHLPLTPVQHLATQSAALLHQRSKLVTAAASYSPIPAAPPAQAPVLTGSPTAAPSFGAPAASVQQLVEGSPNAAAASAHDAAADAAAAAAAADDDGCSNQVLRKPLR